MNRKLFAGAGALALAFLALGGTATADPPHGCCDTGCVKKVCVPVTEMKKHDKRCYSSVCEEFCVPRCSLLGMLRGRCCGDGCGADCGSCERRVREKRVLVVKIRKEEHCHTKCVVSHECAPPPCCRVTACGSLIVAPAHPTPGVPYPPPMPPAGERIPGPK